MALFQSPAKPAGKIHVEFRAGILDWDGKMLTPDKRKGKVFLTTDPEEQLMHVMWYDREKNQMVTDMIVIADAYLQKIDKCKDGRVYVLRNTSHNKKLFFWMQEPKADGDAELIKQFNDTIGATIPEKTSGAPAPAAGGGSAPMDVDEELKQALLMSMQDNATQPSATIEQVRAVMDGVKTPQHYDKVYKDECVFTFNTPFSDGGLSVSLKTWQGFAADMVYLDQLRSGGKGGLYLVQQFRREPKEPEPGAESEPSKLAIGVPGGFMEDKWKVVKEYSLLVVDTKGAKSLIPLPCAELPAEVTAACDAIIAHQGAKSMEETSRWEADQELKESKYAKDLVQLPATRKVSPNPKDWKCEVSGDTQNLWLNLSDGHIGGGRRFFDGSGGSNGALDHFNEEKAKGNFYPLVVKLGTITPSGADVYSYAPDEDDMVKDSNLAEHLAHWGIDVMKMEKTDKTLAEMEVDLNMNHDWSKICESGDKPLVRLRGPGLVGLQNLGNSCYMNSVVQLLLALPEAKARYADESRQIRRDSPKDLPGDLVAQVAKLVNGLCTERYAPPWKEGDDEDDPKLLVAPRMFRTLVGKGHPEFSSGRQQDASEFLQYFLDILSRAERTALGSRLPAGDPFAANFEFALEERLQESEGEKRVKYSRVQQNMLCLPIKLEDAENLGEVTAYRDAHGEPDPKKAKAEGEPEEPKPIIQLETALKRFSSAEDGLPFRGGTASRTQRIGTMPRYLLVSLQRYYLNDKWIPSKLECKVPMPETINIEHLRGKGLQADETALPEEAGDAGAGASGAATAGPVADEVMVAQLTSMGLTENAAKRACLAVQNANAEMAAGWYFEHMEDPDINDPPPAAGGGGAAAGGGGGADPELVATLAAMGFSEAHASAALKACGNNAERAADWLFSHCDDLDGAVAALGGDSAGGGGGGGGGAREYSDGPGEYNLVGFVSHVGKHTSHGHYVCHARRGPGGSWVIFDDSKVAQSEAPPLDLGYVYLYRRKDVSS
eukprot:TRINITY_DN25229_c0_g1_i6.p2 TRINITY_DN25229_c0_g1~~TRINITY_DN25229_c0_g1_i6.p2  ORF type:complete len:1002 (-),score=315.63 TRINITY_DN25229_c0_g1_i6:85-3090(-)